MKVAEVGGGEGRETKECEWNSRWMGGLIPAALMDLNTLIINTITIFIIAIMISFVVAIVLGPLIIAIAISVMKGPGFMTNVAQNNPKCQAGPSSWPELWTDFLG